MGLKAHITYEHGELVARLSDGRQVARQHADELAELLTTFGVAADHVYMPDWRAGDVAPLTGQKIAILSRLQRASV